MACNLYRNTAVRPHRRFKERGYGDQRPAAFDSVRCVFGFVLLIIAVLASAESATAQTSTAKVTVEPMSITDDVPAASEIDDPFEDVNRVISDFNFVFRSYLVDPVVDGYQAVTPVAVQKIVSNVASNLTEPVTVVSSLLQLDFENAGTATQRFVINMAFAGGGAGDLATELGFQQRKEDLGQSLGAHRIGTGPHVVVPILGPSNVRDLAGDVVVTFLNPLPLAASAGQKVANYSDNQEYVEELGKNALDRYSVERATYEQHREFVVSNGEIAGASGRRRH